jgi:hypothetical protein
MGEREVKTQGDKESQATSAMGVENATNNGRRASSRLANKRTTQSGQIGTNLEDIVSSKLMSIISADDSEPESITSDGDYKPPAVAAEKLVTFAVVVRLCLSCKSIATAFVSRSFYVALASHLRALQEPNKEGLVASLGMNDTDDDGDDDHDDDDNGGGKPRAKSDIVQAPSDAVSRRRLVLITVDYLLQV